MQISEAHRSACGDAVLRASPRAPPPPPAPACSWSEAELRLRAQQAGHGVHRYQGLFRLRSLIHTVAATRCALAQARGGAPPLQYLKFCAACCPPALERSPSSSLANLEPGGDRPKPRVRPHQPPPICCGPQQPTMSAISVTSVNVLDNPSKVTNPLQFEIQYECMFDLADGAPPARHPPARGRAPRVALSWRLSH